MGTERRRRRVGNHWKWQVSRTSGRNVVLRGESSPARGDERALGSPRMVNVCWVYRQEGLQPLGYTLGYFGRGSTRSRPGGLSRGPWCWWPRRSRRASGASWRALAATPGHLPGAPGAAIRLHPSIGEPITDAGQRALAVAQSRFSISAPSPESSSTGTSAYHRCRRYPSRASPLSSLSRGVPCGPDAPSRGGLRGRYHTQTH